MLKPGLYEQLVNQSLQKELEFIPSERKLLKGLDEAEASEVISNYLAHVVKQGLDALVEKKGDLQAQINLANKIIALIENANEDKEYYQGLSIDQGSNLLLALLKEKDPLLITGKIKDLQRPETSLSQSTLFTAAANEPQLFSEIKKELVSADRVDMLVSFIRWSGLRLFMEELQKFTSRGGRLRILTTTYIGATEAKAIEYLSKLSNTEIKISYDSKSTRLHAKAYVFYRESGFSTAYVGSSNISSAALTSGLEWNTKISSIDQRATINKIAATIESYWNSPEFESYSENSLTRLNEALYAERYENAKTKADYLNSTLAKQYFKEAISFESYRPYGYQQEILDKLQVERQLHGNYRNLVVAATGTGKTIISALDYKRYLQEHPENPGRLLFVAHRQEILEQSLVKFRVILKDENFGEMLVGNYRPQQSIDHLFISIQSFNSQDFINKTESDFYDFIIIDEFHHAAAPSYQKLLSFYKPKIFLGLTATPERMDGKNVATYFCDKVSAEIRLPEAINRQLLCPFQYFGVTDNVKLNNVKWTAGGYDKSALSDLFTNSGATAENRAALVLNSLFKYVADLNEVKGLGFCVSVENAKFMSEYFSSHNIPSIYLSGMSSESDRALAQLKLLSGEISFIFVVDLYNEGVDIPAVNTILFLRPTESLTVFLQQLGRGLRLCEGKECLTVLDFIGQANRKYNFKDKFAALLSNTKRSLERELENGFISVPKGCYIQLERIASKYILENIKASYSSLDLLTNKLSSFEEESGKAKVTLSSFLDYYHVEPKLLYKFAPFARLCVRSHLRNSFSEPIDQVITPANKDNQTFYRTMIKLSQIDSQHYLRFLIDFLGKLYAVQDYSKLKLKSFINNTLELRMLRMFYMAVWDQYAKSCDDPEVIDNVSKLAQSKILLAELIELFSYRYSKLDFMAKREDLGFDCPLELYCTYTRDELFVALDYEKPKIIREGVKWLSDKGIDVLLVTINKSDKEYSPSTMYNDYAINEELFNWQSQSTTSENSETGKRYINKGSKVLLFVREFKNDPEIKQLAMPYTYLGMVEYVSHEGSRPMNIVWRFKTPLPARFLQRTNKLVVS